MRGSLNGPLPPVSPLSAYSPSSLDPKPGVPVVQVPFLSVGSVPFRGETSRTHSPHKRVGSSSGRVLLRWTVPSLIDPHVTNTVPVTGRSVCTTHGFVCVTVYETPSFPSSFTEVGGSTDRTRSYSREVQTSPVSQFN